MSKVPFDALVYDAGFNHRPIDIPYVHELRGDMAKNKELLVKMKVARMTVAGDDGASETRYKIIDGGHRYHALQDLRITDPTAFDCIAPGGKIEVELTDGDLSKLRDKSVRHNTYRKALEPWEEYAEIRRRTAEGQDQYEIAEVLRIQQPRVAEYLSFEKVCTDGHVLWKQGLLSRSDMVKLASLDSEDQENALAAFRAVTGVADAKEAKAAKAEARKDLGKTAKEKGQTRSYANAGKPTRQKLASYVPAVVVRAAQAQNAVDQAFYNAFAAAFKVFNGELAFEKIDPAKSYYSKKDVEQSTKLLAELEAKAAKKAEKQKTKEKAPPKAPSKKAPKKAPKKASPKKGAKK